MSRLLRLSCSVLAIASLAVSGAAFAQSGGPDASGNFYYSIDNDFLAVGPGTGLGTNLALGNDGEVNVTLPWGFPFYGNSYTSIRVGGTGAITFASSGGINNGNDCLPDSTSSGADLLVFWDGLNGANGPGDAYTYYDTPRDRFIVSWEQVGNDSGVSQGTISFQAHLYSDGTIEYHYDDVVFTPTSVRSYGGSATVGIQDYFGGTATSGNALQISCDTPSLEDDSAFRFHGCPGGDVDGDGQAEVACGGQDCDDNDPAIFFGAPELCGDGIDQDCDGIDDFTDVDGDGDIAEDCGGEDCDDFDAALNADDVDGDGFSSCAGDCDDAVATTYPGAGELCNGLDDDCDGADASTESVDGDGDGFAVCDGDCNDNNAGLSPGLPELCGDAADNDCDGVADNLDFDNDGVVAAACGGPDCDDTDLAIAPGALELCDGIDTDCDGLDDAADLNVGAGLASIDTLTGGSVGPTAGNTPVPYTVTASGLGIIQDVDVTVDLTHSWMGDVEVYITSPQGTTVMLVDERGSSSDNLDTTFDDEAAQPVTSGSPPWLGSYQPEGTLGDFDGESANGTWTLTVYDTFCCNPVGTLNDWSVIITSATVDDADSDGYVDSCGDCDPGNDTINPGAVEICGDGIDQNCSGSDDVDDVDNDGEGSLVCGGLDCDDNDPAVTSISDQDGDGSLDCDDCADLDGAVYPGADETACDLTDSDCDGFDGVGLAGTEDTDGDGQDVCAGDCDDFNATISTAGTEVCGDGADNDCDGLADNVDLDGDGASGCADFDCDDGNPNVFPGALETCDGADLDEDCDGLSDSFDLDTGSGAITVAAPGTLGPIPPTGTSGTGTYTAVVSSSLTPIADVNVTIDLVHTWDSDLDIFITSPLGTQVELSTDNGGSGDNYTNTTFDDEATTPITSGSAPFTGSFQPEGILATFIGEDPNGTWTLTITDDAGGDSGQLLSWSVVVQAGTPVVTDADGDGNVDACGDCDATNGAIFEGAPEVCGDGIDQDCDGADDALDADSDGFDSTDCGGTDCDDDAVTGVSVFPGAPEICNDGIDNDCDFVTVDVFDNDNDGSTCDLDCDDDNPLVFPEFTEICDDGIDNDCDVTTADNADLDGDGFTCDLDCDDTNPNVFPGAVEEFCDSIDNDCDGSTSDIGDGDGDTFGCDLDCDDTDPAVNPAAVETLCDGIDNDCDPSTISDPDNDNDGSTCDLDCDDDDPTVSPDFTEVCDDSIDNDCDPLTADIDDLDLDGVLCDTDCDDDDPLTYPGAPEICDDGVNQDCDAYTDEAADDDYAVGNDGSVHIDLCATSIDFCGVEWTDIYVQANGRITFGFDDDTHAESAADFLIQTPAIAAMWDDLDVSAGGSVHVTEDLGTGEVLVSFTQVPELATPGSEVTFDLLFNTDGSATLIYGTVTALDGLVGYTCGATTVAEVDVSAPALVKGQPKIGNGTDEGRYELFVEGQNPNDLTNTVVELCLTAGEDLDTDGWTDACGDCNDNEPTTHPGALELCDGIDNNCNGELDDVDNDDDGFLDISCGGQDCDDADATVFPDAPELCDGIDNDCDGAPEIGSEDDDGDGVRICGGDCDDTNDAVYEGADEICDLFDNDCDGVVDNGFVSDRDEDGEPSLECGGDDCDDFNPEVGAGTDEVCDEADNDCNGVVDDVDEDGDGFFSDACGGDDCLDDPDLDDRAAEVNPDATEVPYDGLDNDCAAGDIEDADGDGFHSTALGGADCNDDDPAISPAAAEICDDGIDNDCNDAVDADDELCGACSDCNGSLAGGPAGSSQGAVAILLAALLGLRRRREP